MGDRGRAAAAAGRRQRLRLRRHQRPRGAGAGTRSRPGPAVGADRSGRTAGRWRRRDREPGRCRLRRRHAPGRAAPTLAGRRRTRRCSPARRSTGRRPRPGTAPAAVRLGIVDPTAKRLALARRAVAKGRAWRGRGDMWFSPGPPARRGPADGREAGLRLPRPRRRSSRPASTTWPRTSGCPRLAAGAGAGRSADVGRHGAGRRRAWAGCSTPRCAGWASSRTRSPGTASASGPRWSAAGAVRRPTRWTRSWTSFDPDALTRPGPGLRRHRRARRPGAGRARRGIDQGRSRALPRQRAQPVDGVRPGRGRGRARRGPSGHRACSVRYCRSGPASTPRCWSPTSRRSRRPRGRSRCSRPSVPGVVGDHRVAVPADEARGT